MFYEEKNWNNTKKIYDKGSQHVTIKGQKLKNASNLTVTCKSHTPLGLRIKNSKVDIKRKK